MSGASTSTLADTAATTDTAAALRAAEIDAQAILKATNVDGVYSADPHLDPTAERYEEITFTDAIAQNLRVMDTTALSLCRENKIPVIVFDLHTHGNIRRVVQGEKVGTYVGDDNHAD